jgi:hypothetical protein
MADTSMPEEPSGRGRRHFAGIGQPPFNVPAGRRQSIVIMGI